MWRCQVLELQAGEISYQFRHGVERQVLVIETHSVELALNAVEQISGG
jgi:hypothetical protein